jgi:hypothetical protein
MIIGNAIHGHNKKTRNSSSINMSHFNNVRYSYLDRSLSANTSAMLKDPYAAKTFWKGAMVQISMQYKQQAMGNKMQIFLYLTLGYTKISHY